MWKVILLGDEEYDQAYVTQTMVQVITQIEREKAEESFVEAQLHGASVITVVPQVGPMPCNLKPGLCLWPPLPSHAASTLRSTPNITCSNSGERTPSSSPRANQQRMNE